MNGICYIVGAGEETPLDFTLTDSDFLIACDGGLTYLNKYGYTPDIIIGDFDSLGYIPEGKTVVRLNPIKDDTDVLAAVKHAYNLGYDDFRFYCCLGGTISHTFANIQILTKLSRDKKRALFIGKEQTITAITDGELTLPAAVGFISVFTPDIAYGVNLKGLKYPLKNYTLKNDFPLGVSNEFIDVSASVSVRYGTLIVIYPSDVRYPF